MGKYILVVDRSHTICVTCKIHLENEGHRVITVPTSIQALKELPTYQPAPDILLLGLRDDSSDIESRALIVYLKKRAPLCRGIVLARSGVVLPDWTTPFEVLVTPFTILMLLEIVNSASMVKGTR